MLNDFFVRHKSTFSDFMEIYVEIFSTNTEFFSKCSSETFNKHVNIKACFFLFMLITISISL
jgi:hypothetical protein